MGALLLLPTSSNLYPQGYIPNTNQMFYPQDDVNSPIKDNSILPELEPHTLQTFRNIKIDKVEQQRAYHAHLFKLNCLLDPDQITERPFDIIGHTQVRNANRVITKMQIKYTTPSMVCAYNDNVENVDLEDLRIDHPWQCIAYASKHKLLYHDGFCEWITPHLETDKDLAVMIHNYRVSTMTHRIKYGVELPRSAKHALELDKRNGDHKWADAMRKEIMQMIHEYKAFRVHDSNIPPEGYQKLRYHFVFDAKIDGQVKA